MNLRVTHTNPRIQSKYRRRGSPPRVSASHFEVRTTTSVKRGAKSQTNTCHTRTSMSPSAQTRVTLVLVCRRQRTRRRARAHTRTPSHKQTPTRNRVLIQSTVEIVVGVTVKSHSCEDRAARPRQKLHKHQLTA